ncbi:hypothetical protein IP92_03383 [Pseudoduganella flava]|uniref:Uncharacterized protein n=1 Tax=Pseudoduganella flava TaxID=871742 RepID=A0A562PNB0_9BURK|nr:hypothetical protein [Pseudoduganella flava]QGZ40509.1 hypothetical protein GO485_16560 [Pseudoduganella flava]TWI45952.1 hypothetical protein IP92_03383 [Pseudoduganella flava]
MEKFAFVAASATLLSACGGGGGGDAAAPSTPTPPPQTAATVNVSEAVSRLLFTDRTASGLASNDGYLGTATLIVKADESYPFVVGSNRGATAVTRVVSLMELGTDGRLIRKLQWKLHFDAARKPIGIAVTDISGDYRGCVAVDNVPALPGAASGSGVYAAGTRGSYTEGYKDGSFGHQCSATAGGSAQVAWTVQQGTVEPYACLTLPAADGTPLLQVCSSGSAGETLFVRKLASDGTSHVDYRGTGANRPVFPPAGAVNPRDYWYGNVWRPLDGYVYQSYEQVKFATQEECRNQTTIDWRATYSATNIGWMCSRVIAH